MIQIVVLAGGAGEKLWPLSRQKMPKQFLKLLNDNTSLFQNTITRILDFINYMKLENNQVKLTVICNDSNKFMVKDELKELIPDIEHNIIAEPISRGTTAAIAISLELSDDNDNMLIIPSDQIWDSHEFSMCIKKLFDSNKNCISLIGITPYYPATRFGYIQIDNNKLVKFNEKPNNEDAIKYINSETKDYLWNSGVLFFKNKIMYSEIKRNCNHILEQIKLVINNSEHNDNIISLNKNLFSNVDSLSIDYSVLENYKDGFVIKYNNYWTDIDGFKSLFDYHQKDKNYNLLQSKDNENIITVDTKNSYIYSENKLVTTLGISDMIIVDTHDSLLVANRNSSPDVPEIVKILKSQSRSEHIVNPICYKPWGWYLNFEGSDYSGHRVKKICVYPNCRLSLQSHKERSEHWIIVKGNAKVRIGEDHFNMTINQTLYIPKGVLHRLENIGEENVEIIETQIGNYLGEDDIIRYEDDFGR